MSTQIKTLGDALPEEIKRCTELLTQYAAIGPAGNFGAAMIRLDIQNGVNALESGDVVAMMAAYEVLKGCK